MQPSRDRKKTRNLGHVPNLHFPTLELHPAEENISVYRPVCADDSEILALADSIRKDGVLQPLVITKDKVILSGHRRWMAAQVAGLPTVPCVVENFEP